MSEINIKPCDCQDSVGLRSTQQNLGMGGCGCGGGINPAYWGRIYGNIRDQKDLMALINSGAAKKEVITVLTYSETEPQNPSDGDMWIDSDNNALYSWDASESEWVEETPSKDNIYITLDTSHMYLWDGFHFIDTAGQVIDNTIYVNNLTTDLADYINSGIFTVCHHIGGTMTQYYTMTVQVQRGRQMQGRPRIDTFRQILWNYGGYMVRTKQTGGEWSDWGSFEYASVAYVDEAIEQAIQPSSDKEVYTVLTAGTTAPSSASADDLYINTSDNKLYKYTNGLWVEDSDDITTDAVYIAEDTGHVWIYNGTAFVDSGGSTVDNVIYVDNLNTNDDLNSCITPGVYTVCYKKTNTEVWFSLVVQVVRHVTVLSIKQTLSNQNGYRARSRFDIIQGENNIIGTWGYWYQYDYAKMPQNYTNGNLAMIADGAYVDSGFGAQELYNLACAGLVL